MEKMGLKAETMQLNTVVRMLRIEAEHLKVAVNRKLPYTQEEIRESNQEREQRAAKLLRRSSLMRKDA